MQSQNRIFDDLAKFMNAVAGTVAGAGREAEAGARERAREWFGGMDFVSREEFDAVKEMAATARAEAEALKVRIDALEKGAVARPAASAKTAAKPATKAPPKAAPKSSPRKPAAKKQG
ncbi:MAG: accessory factor UbiK family protein [Parasphingorhabdus sp.]|nr:accessory factor UbiK family protein [Parasphingorhabdus sp.]